MTFTTNFKEPKVKLTAKAEKAVYEHVDQRDGLRCRCCGEYGGIDIHRHHIRGRKFHNIHDVCNICDDCHGLMHVRLGGKKLQMSGDAEQRSGAGVLNGLTFLKRVTSNNHGIGGAVVRPPDQWVQDGDPR